MSTVTAEKLSTLVKIPMLAHTSRTLRELRGRRSTSAIHLVRALERDPALSLGLLITANRDLKHAGLNFATNLQRAVIVFGVVRFLDESSNHSVIEKDTSIEYLRPLRHHLARTHLAANLAYALANQLHAVNPDDAFCLAMIHDIDSYTDKLLSAAKLKLNWEATRALFPSLARTGATNDSLQWCANKASEFAVLSSFCWDEKVLLPYFDTIAKKLDQEPLKVEKLFKQVSLRAARNSRDFNDFPAARFMMNVGKQKPILALQFPAKNRPFEPSKKKKPVATKTKSPNPNQNSSNTTKVTRKHFDSEALKKLTPLVEKAAKDLIKLGSQKSTQTRVLPYGLQLIVSLMNIKKALFISHPSPGNLIARIQASANKSPSALKLEIAIAKNRLLEKVLETGRPMHISAEKIARSSGLLDSKLGKFVGTAEVYCLPLKVGPKYIGLILTCVDKNSTNNWSKHFALTETIANHIATALEARDT